MEENSHLEESSKQKQFEGWSYHNKLMYSSEEGKLRLSWNQNDSYDQNKIQGND